MRWGRHPALGTLASCTPRPGVKFPDPREAGDWGEGQVLSPGAAGEESEQGTYELLPTGRTHACTQTHARTGDTDTHTCTAGRTRLVSFACCCWRISAAGPRGPPAGRVCCHRVLGEGGKGPPSDRGRGGPGGTPPGSGFLAARR